MSIPERSFPQVGPSYLIQESGTQKISTDIEKFFTHFEAADIAFRKLDKVPDSKEGKAEFSKELESAYGLLSQIYQVDANFFEKPDNLNKISRLFFLLGRLEYGGQMEKSRHYLQASLLLKLASLGLAKTDVLNILMAHSSTSALQDSLSKENPELRSVLTDLPENILKSIDKKELLAIADKTQVFELACILRWLGHACQNIDVLNKNLERFEIIYRLAKECNQNVIERSSHELMKDANWEMAELLYNTDRFMYHFKAPTDVMGKMQLLDNVKPYLKAEGDSLRASTKLAQIENIQAIEKSKIPNCGPDILETCYEHANKALKIAEETANFDLFLLNMFRNNSVTFALKTKRTHFDELNNRMSLVLAYAKENEHYYNPIFYIGAARLKNAQGEKDKALELLDKADEISKKSPENSADFIKSAQTLREEILGVQK